MLVCIRIEWPVVPRENIEFHQRLGFEQQDLIIYVGEYLVIYGMNLGENVGKTFPALLISLFHWLENATFRTRQSK